jgi:hypothetical protein
LVVTALAFAVLVLAGCSHEAELKESPAQAAKEQAAADAHNADTVPFAGDDETPSSETSAPTTTTQVEYEGVQALHVGDCVDLPTRNAASVRAVGCDRPHHAEVTARIDIGSRFPNGTPTPEDWRTLADTECKHVFDSYVRQPLPQVVEPGSLDPTPEGWFQGDHVLVCTAEADREGNVLTGSVRKPA